jgi:aminomethyltransferase
MVDFGGWDMPINYGSQIEEHHQVRNDAGMFDVSHMTVVDLKGNRAREFLRYLLANNVDKLNMPGKALYSCMLDDHGGVIDDLIVYAMNDAWFRMVVNAATREKDVAWLERQAEPFGVAIKQMDAVGMIAVQGPNAREKFAEVLGDSGPGALSLGRFFAATIDGMFVARTGYTGEDGFEVVVPASRAAELWQQLSIVGVKPCGLGARDTLRLEAGMNLYGQDMDEECTPFEAGLGWTVAMEPKERDFIGRQALELQKATGVNRAMVGLVLEDKGVLRHGQSVICDAGKGVITSGTYSPSLARAIAFARVPTGTEGHVQVEIRGKHLAARVVRPPFVRDGQPCEGI